MKKITEYSEKEILALTKEDIDLIIKLAKAEAGIKFITCPMAPNYYEIPKPKKEIFTCNLLGNSLAFSNHEDIKSFIKLLTTLGFYSIDSSYDPSAKWISNKIKTMGYSSEPWDKINAEMVYFYDEYQKIKETINENSKLKLAYDNAWKEFNANEDLSADIVNEIYDRVNEVIDKYDNLNRLCRKFKNDYLPLSDNNEKIALKFIDKAYSLTEEQKEYVLSNYKQLETL